MATTVQALLDGKTSVPSDMRTAEWSMLPQWIRERTFYMAGVHQAEILQEFRKEATLVATGEAGIEESRKRLEIFLDGIGYKPLPGQEGTIKDLRSMRRIQTSLRTNSDLLQGWAKKNRGLLPGALRAFPGWELVRLVPKKVPRTWPALFTRAGGVVTEDGRMIALKTSQVWVELGQGDKDSLGVDYPPFKWGSGMGWQAVPFPEMKKLGFMDGYVFPPARPITSPNESLEVKPKVSDRALRDALAERMKGLAEWQGDTFRFTDPNGTRPYTAEKLAEVWARPLPETFADLRGGGQMQREAFFDWVIDSGVFWHGSKKGEPKMGRTDWWEDFQRVMLRLLPSGRESEPLFRGLKWQSQDKFQDFLTRLKRVGYAPRPETPAESWSASLIGAQKYLAGRYQVLLKLPAGHSSGRDLAPLVRAFQAELLKRESPQGKLVVTDNECILPNWAGLKVKKIHPIKETAMGKSVTIELEEVAQ